MKSTLVRLGSIVTLGIGITIYGSACGGDVEGPADTGDEETTEQTDDDGDTTSTGGNNNNTTTSGTGGGEIEECGPSSIDPDDPCELCVATSCTTEALACCEQPGCLDIISCAQDTGCSGLDCYAPETCKDVIDSAGGPITATQFAQPLGDCAIANCSAECGT